MMISRFIVRAGFLAVFLSPPINQLYADELVSTYRTMLSDADKAAQDGLLLTDVAAILMRDRANYFLHKRRDAVDEPDRVFMTTESQRLIIHLLAAGEIDDAVVEAILAGDVVVDVAVLRRPTGDYLRVTLAASD